MKEEFITPVIDFVLFSAEDVITTSLEGQNSNSQPGETPVETP